MMKSDQQLLEIESERRLVSAVLHDMQSGLQGLLSWSDSLTHETRKPDPNLKRIAMVAEDIGAVTGMLIEMTNNLRRGPLPRPTFPIDAGRVVGNVLAMFKSRAQRKGLSFRVSDRTANVTMIASEPLVRQVIFNLVDNSVKYSHSTNKTPATVDVVLRKDRRHLEISLQNIGIPIHQDEIHLIFEAFHRGREAAAYVPSGTGMGLYISSKILKEAGGNLWLESRPLGTDNLALTTATARFPLAERPDGIDPISVEEPTVG